MSKKIYLASPRGFCAGVRRALAIVDLVLDKFSPPVFVFNQIVHNNFIVESLRRRGVVFVETLTGIPAGSPLIFSAHGVSSEVETQARAMKLNVIDATCPLVKKIHHKAGTLSAAGHRIIIIGHKGHPEIIGTLGQIEEQAEIVESVADVMQLPPPDEREVSCLTQTTLSVYDTSEIIEALRRRFVRLNDSSSDICYATRRRQEAVIKLCPLCDLILVVGSPKSSNSNRLKETAGKYGVRTYLIDSAADITDRMLAGVGSIGITAGASAPEYLIDELVKDLMARGWDAPEEIVSETEKVDFSVPVL